MFGVVALLKLQMRWGAHSFYRLHCGAADGRKEAAFVIIFCVIYYLMRREMEETRAKRMRTSAFHTRKERGTVQKSSIKTRNEIIIFLSKNTFDSTPYYPS